MDKYKGWVAIYRAIQNHWLWEDKPFSKGQAWIDLILLANHTKRKFLFNGELIEVERGCFITSQLKLAERWGWSRTKVRAYLKLLQTDEMITYKSDKHKTTITIINYDLHQSIPEEKTDNTEEKPKKKRKNSNTKQFIPPTVEEIQEYIKENDFQVDANLFRNYYLASGWELSNGRKMKDWKSEIKKWNDNQRQWTSYRCKSCKYYCYNYEKNDNYCFNVSSKKYMQFTSNEDGCQNWEEPEKPKEGKE